jgi:hypothetical protein
MKSLTPSGYQANISLFQGMFGGVKAFFQRLFRTPPAGAGEEESDRREPAERGPEPRSADEGNPPPRERR